MGREGRTCGSQVTTKLEGGTYPIPHLPSPIPISNTSAPSPTTTVITASPKTTLQRDTHLEESRHQRRVLAHRCRPNRLAIFVDISNRRRRAELEGEIGPVTEESRDLVSGGVGGDEDAVNERGRAGILGVEKRRGETLSDTVNDTEKEERECVGGEGNACQLRARRVC